MSPTLPPPPAAGPATREIPVVDPAGAVGGTTTGTPRATGPVDHVAGPPAGATPEAPVATAVLGAASPTPAGGPLPPVPPAAEAPRDFVVDLTDGPRGSRRRGGVRPAALLLGAGAAVVLQIGLLVPVGTATLWSRVPLWSAFATVAGLATLAGVAARVTGRHRSGAMRVAAAGLGGLAVFWLLVALPTADTDRGFLLTAGLAGLALAVRTAGRSGAPGVEEAGQEG